jgi:hypothetical protein
MGGHFDSFFAGNGGEGQRGAIGLGSGRQAIEVECELADRSIGGHLLRQRQRPIGRRSLDEKIDRRGPGRGDLDKDAVVRTTRLPMHGKDRQLVAFSACATLGILCVCLAQLARFGMVLLAE